MSSFISKISNNLIKIISICFAIVYGWFFINNVFNNSNDLIHYNMKLICAISAVVLGGIILLGIIRIKYINLHIKSKNKKYIYYSIMLLVVVLQIILTRLIYSNPGFDAGAIIKAGEDLAIKPNEFAIQYFSWFPNNVFLAYIFKNIYLLSSYLGTITYERLLVIINICCIDISILMSLAVAEKVNKKQSVLGMYFLFILLFGFSPWIGVAYSDTFSMMFPITILYLYIRSKECNTTLKRCILYAVIGALGVIGFQIKPTAIIIIIAILIGKFLYAIKEKEKLVHVFSFLLVVSIAFCGAKVIYNNTVANMEVNGVILNENKDLPVPMTHFLMMGLNTRYIEDRGYLYGAWSEDDYEITLGKSTKEEKVRANFIEIKRRLIDFGPIGYIKFLSNKGNWMISDGTFYYGGEGAISQDYLTKTTLAEKVRGYYAFTGEKYNSLAGIFQSIWTVVLFLVVLASIFVINSSEEVFIIKLGITGITLFLLLFECRSRYLINHLPIFMVMVSMGLNKSIEMIGNIKISLHQK